MDVDLGQRREEEFKGKQTIHLFGMEGKGATTEWYK